MTSGQQPAADRRCCPPLSRLQMRRVGQEKVGPQEVTSSSNAGGKPNRFDAVYSTDMLALQRADTTVKLARQGEGVSASTGSISFSGRVDMRPSTEP